MACPRGAVCPGGTHVWPQPGSWTDNGTVSGSMVTCTPPRRVRCPGWRPISSSNACGRAYAATSPVCGSCTAGYFPMPTGVCEVCPYGSNTALPYIVVFLIVVGVGLLIAGMVTASTFRRGGTFAYGFKRGLEFFAFSCVLVQVLAQVAAAAQPALFSAVERLFKVLLLFELDVSPVIHPACVGGYRFSLEAIQFVGGIVLALLAGVLSLRPFRHPKDHEYVNSRIPAVKRSLPPPPPATIPADAATSSNPVLAAKQRMVAEPMPGRGPAPGTVGAGGLVPRPPAGPPGVSSSGSGGAAPAPGSGVSGPRPPAGPPPPGAKAGASGGAGTVAGSSAGASGGGTPGSGPPVARPPPGPPPASATAGRRSLRAGPGAGTGAGAGTSAGQPRVVDSGVTMGDTEELQVTRPVMLGTVRQEQLRQQAAGGGGGGGSRRGVLARVRDHNPLTLRLLHMALTLVYAVVATSFFRVTDCVHVPGVAAGDRVLRSDTSVVCYSSEHMPVFVLAWVCLVVYLVAWPVVSFVYLLWFHVRDVTKVEYQFSHRKSHMAFFCAGDFRWNQYFFRHAVLLIEFVLGYVVSRALALELRAVVITEVVLGVYLVGLVVVRPYAESKAWKFPIHVGVVIIAMIIGILNYVLYSGVEESRDGVRRFAEGVSWLVFALVVGLFLVLLVTGWWYLLQGADRHATDLEQVGVKSGSNRVVLGSIRWRHNPAKPRSRLRSSLRAVAAAVRMRLALLSPRFGRSPAAAGAASGDSGSMPGAGVGSGEEHNMDSSARPSTSIEMRPVGVSSSSQPVPEPADPGPKPQGPAPGTGPTTGTRTTLRSRPSVGHALVHVGDIDVRVPVAPPSANAEDSPTGQIADHMHQFMFAASRAAPARHRVTDPATRTGFQNPRGSVTGAGSGPESGAGTPVSPAATPRGRRGSATGFHDSRGASGAGGGGGGGGARAGPGVGARAAMPSTGAGVGAGVGAGEGDVSGSRAQGRSLAARRNRQVARLQVEGDGPAAQLPTSPATRATFAAIAPRHGK